MNKKVKHTLINIGTSKDRSIKDYAKLILDIISHETPIFENVLRSIPAVLFWNLTSCKWFFLFHHSKI